MLVGNSGIGRNVRCICQGKPYVEHIDQVGSVEKALIYWIIKL